MMALAAGGSAHTLRPSTRIRPSSGRSSPVIIDSDVVLPAPFGPTSPASDPAAMSRSTPATACLSPKLLRSPLTEMPDLPVSAGLPISAFPSRDASPLAFRPYPARYPGLPLLRRHYSGDVMAEQTPRLTSLSPGAGCACKLPLAKLEQLFAAMGPTMAPAGGDLLIGAAEGDDAAVLRLDDERALVLTTDFFTPIVDDPGDWGRIAAANALSDVYAMGGRPVLALNLTAWPGETLPLSILADVLRGGASVAAAAGCLGVGGHPSG